MQKPFKNCFYFEQFTLCHEIQGFRKKLIIFLAFGFRAGESVLEHHLTVTECSCVQKLIHPKNNHRIEIFSLTIFRWCLSIYNLSPAAYKQISSKRLNFMRLPCIETLRKYINFTKPSTGFNPDIIERLIVDSDLENLEDFQKDVALSFDEMKIKSDLVYQRYILGSPLSMLSLIHI